DDDDDDDDENGFYNRGCLFDAWENAYGLKLGMVCARLCATCRSVLSEHGAPPESLNAIDKILDWVRATVLGRERPLPRKVFIGHGSKNDWQALRTMLVEWNVEVEEFNEEPVAGVSITQRLKSMLEGARFAFLVMTAEDEVIPKGGGGLAAFQARMNVIHEIGLFQGRLGGEYAVVIRERGAELFSNLDGINRIDFDSGRLKAVEPEIFALLVRRGVIHADAQKQLRARRS
ncbi:MAG: TIR domain-containing protein, partial [Polyangiaceae bacterium]